MARIAWNQPGERRFETGIDRGVLYLRNGVATPWNGLVSINETSTGGDVESLYFDGIKYLDVIGNEDFQATLEAFSAPPEFAICEGVKTLSPGLFASQQPRQTFGLSYRTLIGNDLQGVDHGYKLHIVYGCTAAPSPRGSKTLNKNPDITTRQWTLHTVPPPANLYKPTAHFIIDSTQVDHYMLEDLESYLYGRDDREPALIPQTEVISILANRITEPLDAFI